MSDVRSDGQPPPRIEGFEHVKPIGRGGSATVHLYRQHKPRRLVAVKVLHSTRSPQDRARFDAEADLMASLSSHPYIVTLYQAGLADDGRPYLAMEHCSREGFGTRFRTERFTVPEILRTGIQLAGAVETAHRAGILHRDIKPANVLVTDYGRPALTDFGISVTLDEAGRAEGMSVPWSPPESFAERPVAGVATDVWALAATLYTLLARRSPFEVPGGSNNASALRRRICLESLPPLGRPDVPPSLELVLATAMSKRPEARWPSVLDLARALQQVESQESLTSTPVDVLDLPAAQPDDTPSAGPRASTPVLVPPGLQAGVTAPATARLLELARRRAATGGSTQGAEAVPVATTMTRRHDNEGGR